MRKPPAAVPGRNSISSAAGDAAQVVGGTRRVFPNLLFLQRPPTLDRGQVWRVVRGRNSISSAAGDASQVVGGTRRVFPNLLFLQRPPRLDRVQVWRIGRQI